MKNVKPEEIRKGDIVQVDPEVKGMFAGCLVVVTEIRAGGIQGYVQIPGAGQACVRKDWDEIEFVGTVVWMTVGCTEDCE